MRIRLDNNLVEFSPENDREVKELDALWKVVVDCVKSNKKLVPVGRYMPDESKLARFSIEE
jgi:hypothetical protein